MLKKKMSVIFMISSGEVKSWGGDGTRIKRQWPADLTWI
jgi:hypothetical protein